MTESFNKDICIVYSIGKVNHNFHNEVSPDILGSKLHGVYNVYILICVSTNIPGCEKSSSR